MTKFGENIKVPINYDSLTQQQRSLVREKYIKLQKGYCPHCKVELTRKPPEPRRIDWDLFPPGFRNHPVHLHHCRKTGMTIGAVHAYCNAYMWQYLGE